MRNDPAMASTGFLAVAADSRENIERFDQATGGALPTIRDPGSIAKDYGVSESAAVILVDADGVVRYRLDGFAGPRFRQRLDATLQALRQLPALGGLPARQIRLEYTRHPRAPVFAARDIDGTMVSLAALRGRVVVLSFFDQESPPCRQDLARLVPVIREMRARGVRAIGVASRDVDGGMRRFMKEHGIDYPVIIDAGRDLFTRFESTQTPDLFIIDAHGFVRFREPGDRPDRAELTRLQLRLALGQEDPSVLAAALPGGRLVGDGQCAACHEREWRDWLWTPHSVAWDSLPSGDRSKDSGCVTCHVTGLGRPGGFSDADTTPHMTNVQCEACHGMGGGHGAGAEPAAPLKTCETCHTGQFVLKDPLETALRLVAHGVPPDLDRLFRYSERQRRHLDQINERRLVRFDPGVAHVGAEACRDCHRREYDQWVRTPHEAAYARLLRDARGADPACTPCHTTGFGLKDGFPAASGTASLTGVQCEVCHGPGGDHVRSPDDLKKETIYGLTSDCPSCLVQGVCTACHDSQNDPDFELETALAKVKH